MGHNLAILIARHSKTCSFGVANDSAKLMGEREDK